MYKLRSKFHLLLLILAFIFIIDISIILNIAILRPIAGLCFLIFPGSIILKLLDLKNNSLSENVVLTIGTSVSFFMITGVIINNISLHFGYNAPLSEDILLIVYSVLYTILTFITYFSIKTLELKKNWKNKFWLSKQDKLNLIPIVFLPAISCFGIYMMNMKNSNYFLLFLLTFIVIHTIYVNISGTPFSSKIYPIMIYSYSLSVVLIYMLRFPHINGNDVHEEYWIYYMTSQNLKWVPLLSNTLDSIISISLFPTIVQSISGFSSSELFFKGIYVFICSFNPLAIFIIAKKYLNEKFAFLSSFYFLSQPQFIMTAGSPRTAIAIFISSLLIMTLFNDEMSSAKKRFLCIVFILSVTLSHYSTSYLLFVTLLLTLILATSMKVLIKFESNNGLTFRFLTIFFILIFFWYSQVSELAFSVGVDFVVKTLTTLNQLFITDSRVTEVPQLLGKNINSTILYMNIIILWISFIFIAVGIIRNVYDFKKNLSIHKFHESDNPIIRKKFDVEFLTYSVGCCCLLILILILPTFSLAYDTYRLYSFTAISLSIYYVYGGSLLAKFVHKQYTLLLIVSILYFMVTTGLSNTLIDPDLGPMTLSTQSKEFNYMYVFESESASASWLANNMIYNLTTIAPDAYVQSKLVSQAKLSPNSVTNYNFYNHKKPKHGYIYLGYENVINGQFEFRGTHKIEDYSDMFVGANKIYSNSKSEVYFIGDVG